MRNFNFCTSRSVASDNEMAPTDLLFKTQWVISDLEKLRLMNMQDMHKQVCFDADMSILTFLSLQQT